jgi:N-acetyl-beta-hexosaminidase
MIHTPVTIPNLREWMSIGDYLTLPETKRLVINSSHAEELDETAKALTAMFNNEFKWTPIIVIGSQLVRGDIFLTLNPDHHEIGDQGYLLELDKHVTIQAKTVTGVFYGGLTLVQMLRQAPLHSQLPRGHGRDYPHFQYRGIMLDAGRKYWEMSYLFKLIRQMARLKLNVLHLHLSDWNAFRLESDRFPGLATFPAYSKAEIMALQSYARQWHVTIVPEIDLPAHATVMTRYEPSLAFDCRSMSTSRWVGGESGGWTIDYTKPAARQWMMDLLGEYLTFFDGPYFHIGADEVPEGNCINECPSLLTYAKERGYLYTGDILIEWLDEMNQFLKAHGKNMQIWNWFERSPHSLTVDNDVIINTWVGNDTPGKFLDAGFKIIDSPENTHYLTPGLALYPDHQYLYHDWMPNLHPNMLGYKICVWADQLENESDAYFDSLLNIPCAILAGRTWNPDTPSGSLDEFFNQADILLPRE